MDDGRGKKTFLQDRYENNIRIYLLCKEKIVYYHQEVNMKVIFNHKVHDYPKRHGDLKLAWYGNGNFCIVRKQTKRQIQQQNLSIIQINRISKVLWDELDNHFKKDLARYARMYKQEYPSLRKRGISSYSCFLMIVHALIKRFSLNSENEHLCINVLKRLLHGLSVFKAISLKLIKSVKASYKLNRCNAYQIMNNKEMSELSDEHNGLKRNDQVNQLSYG